MSNDPNNTAAEGAEGSGEAVNWGELNDNIAPGSDDDFEPSSVVPPADAASEEGAGEPPPAAAAPAAVVPPAPVVEPPAPKGPQTTPAPTAEELAAARAEFTTKLSKGLEDNFTTQISEEDARELVVNPEKVLPKLMSKAAMAGMELAISMMHQQLPQLIKQSTSEQLSGRELETKFYSENSDLRGHSAVVNKMVAVAKATLDENASQDDILKEAADLARRKLKLAAPAPAASAAPAKPRAWAPAKAGGSAPTPAAKSGTKDDNIWAKLAEDED